VRSDQQNDVHLSFAPVANKNTVTSQRDGGISILKYLFAFIFWYNLSIFTLQQKARKTASRKSPLAVFLLVFSQTTRP
jgi:hypothetical protein